MRGFLCIDSKLLRIEWRHRRAVISKQSRGWNFAFADARSRVGNLQAHFRAAVEIGQQNRMLPGLEIDLSLRFGAAMNSVVVHDELIADEQPRTIIRMGIEGVSAIARNGDKP